MRYYSIALALCLATTATVSVQAQRKVKPVKGTPVKVSETRPDTVSISDFSYAMGILHTQGLTGYASGQFGLDTAFIADFMRGYDAYLNAAGDEAKRQAAYSAGVQVGRQYATQILPGTNRQFTGQDGVAFVDEARMRAGFSDAVRGTQTISSDSALTIVKKQNEYYEGIKKEKASLWMQDNAKQKGVKLLTDGVQYRVISDGAGKADAADTSEVKVHYEGRLTDGTVFDSSYKRGQPAKFKLSQVIKGWQTALKAMPVGATWEIYIPYEMAYGERGTQGIPPYSPLIFKVELLEVTK